MDSVLNCDLEMSTTGKTPVSLLNETLIRHGCLPMYTLKQDAVGTNQGSFVYEVTAGDLVTAVGHGRSKKEAKQQAAKKALLKLTMDGEVIPEPITDDPDSQLNIVSPYEAELKENAVGRLSDVCSSHEMPLPQYVQVREDGPPHAKVFEFSCRVASVVVFAVGRTKKQAKQMAASHMLRNLNLYLEDPKPHPTEAVDGPSRLSTDNACPYDMARYPLGLRVGQGFKHDWSEEKIAFLQSQQGPFEDPVCVLNNICSELNLVVEKTEIEAADEGTKLILLSLTTVPTNVAMGFGSTEAEAIQMASEAAITFLQIITKSPNSSGTGTL